MALLRENGKYIKMNSYGWYEAYIDEETRKRQKAAPSYDEIVNKYNELIQEGNKYIVDLFVSYLESRELTIEEAENLPEEEQKEILESFKKAYPRVKKKEKKLLEISDELHNYIIDVNDSKGAKHSYPIISEYFENVADSVPYIVDIGQIFIDEDDVATVYEISKERKLFGDTTDV